MLKHKKVKSAVRIAQDIVDFIAAVHIDIIAAEGVASAFSKYNGILCGRGDMSPEALILMLESIAGTDHMERAKGICADIEAFLSQKRLLTVPYGKAGSKEYKYRYFNAGSGAPLKIINQRVYDSAVKNGFPPNFFRESYFDGVVFYCIPDNTDFCFSYFRNCQFIICRIWQARFDGANFSDAQFHTAYMSRTTFYGSSMTHTHIYDSLLISVSFQKVRMKSCNIANSILDQINFLNATLDGCRYGGLATQGTQHLETATITMGGATNEECRRNRKSIFHELGVVMTKDCKLCGAKMVWENPHLPGHFHENSRNLDDWDICLDCMIEHCCQTNCLMCGYGKHPKCRFLEMKNYYKRETTYERF